MLDLQQNKNLTAALIVLTGGFLAVLIVSNAIDISNKIKESRFIGQDIETRRTITVSGTGEVYARPDLAVISFSAITEAKTVAEALSQNTQKMNSVIDFAKNQGVESKDLKTTNFNISPLYEYTGKSQEFPQGKRILVGYEVQQSLEVKIRNLEKTGQIIEGASQVGANQVGDLQFTIDNQDELKKQARGKAIDDAKEKAKELSDQLGVKLAKIVSFSESGGPPIYFGAEKLSMGGAGTAPQIETGENKIQMDVSITYEIN